MAFWTTFGRQQRVKSLRRQRLFLEALEDRSLPAGFSVLSTSPAVNAIVNAVPLDYVVNFSAPIDAATVDAGDFQVTDNSNTARPADSFVVNNPTQVNFHYNAAPFSSLGSHTMSMGAGSVLDMTATLLDAFSGSLTLAAGAATHLAISSPANATAGSAFSITVTALDAANNVAAGYAGTIHFTTSDARAGLPADAKLSSGVGTFSITLKTSGNQTITATDTVATAISANTGNVLVSAAAATHFTVLAPANTVAGNSFSLFVFALDAFNNTATPYMGIVHFSSGDTQKTLPADTSLTNGAGSFVATLRSVGSWTVTANDSVNSSISGSTSTIVVAPGPIAQLIHSALTNVVAGRPINLTITALDAFNNTATGYLGTLRFASSDPQAALPADRPLSNASGTFTVTLRTLGGQTLSIADTTTGAILTSFQVTVIADTSGGHFSVLPTPGAVSAGGMVSFTVTALDGFNQTAADFTGTVHFTSSDSTAVLPLDATLTSGVGTFTAKLTSPGNQTVTAATTSPVGVLPYLILWDSGRSGLPALEIPLVKSSLRTRIDATPGPTPGSYYLGVDEDHTSTGTWDTDLLILFQPFPDGTVVLTATHKDIDITGSHYFNLRDASGITLVDHFLPDANAVYTIPPANISGTSSPISVSPASTHFTINAPTSAIAGAAFTVNVTALDTSNNVASGYSGTIHFTSNDGQASLPADGTLTSGQGSFTVTLKTAGAKSITATDTANAGIAGFSNSMNVAAIAATHFGVVGSPSGVTAGNNVNFSVTALDPFNNLAKDYGGTVAFSSSDPAAALPPDTVLTSGSGLFTVSLKSVGNRTLAVTDNANSTIAGVSNTITVIPLAATHFLVSSPAAATAGASFLFTVAALDSNNNTATAYNGTLRFSSSDALAGLPANFTLTSGVGVFSASLKTDGSQTLTAADSQGGSVNGTSNAINVQNPQGQPGLASSANSSVFGQEVTFTATLNATQSTTPGLTASYYNLSLIPGGLAAAFNLPDATPTANATLVATRTEAQVNVPFNSTAFVPSPPVTGLAPNNIAVSWAGLIQINAAGTYTFFSHSEDGSILYVDGITAGANDGSHSQQDGVSTPLSLTAGLHSFLELYVHDNAGAGVWVDYQGPDTGNVRTLVPGSALFHGYPGGTVTFYDNGLPIGSGQMHSSGNAAAAAFTTFSLASGNHFITAGYDASGSFGANPASAAIIQHVGPAPTTTTTSVQATPSTLGQSVTLKATVTPNDPSNGLSGLSASYYNLTSSVANVSGAFDLATGAPTSIAALVANRIDAQVAIPLNDTALRPPVPVSGLAGANVAVSWVGAIRILQGGTYTFFNPSDDGSMLYVDGTLVANNDGNHTVQDGTSTPIALTAGLHQFLELYVQNGSSAAVEVDYQGPDTSGTRRLIPANAFFHGAIGLVQFVIDGANYGSPVVVANGVATISADLAGGRHTVSATFIGNSSFQASNNTALPSSWTVNGPHLVVTAPVSVAAHTPFNFMVAALDASNNALTSFNGTVHFTSSDHYAALPSNATLTNGVGMFSAVLSTVAGQSITAAVVADFPSYAEAPSSPYSIGPFALEGNGLTGADVNGDGKPDLLASEGIYINNVGLLLGRGNGTFDSQSVVIGSHYYGNAPVAGDFNGDGKVDLAIPVVDGNNVSDAISVVLGTGNGTFTAPTIYPIGSTGGTVVGDFNNDGNQDLALIIGDNNIGIMLGVGNGTFQSPLQLPISGGSRGLIAADYNGDGSLDLAFTNQQSSVVGMLLGRGDGTFNSAVSLGVGALPGSIITCDLNHDGKLDMVVANSGTTSGVSVLLGYGNGAFGIPKIYGAGTFARQIVPVDLNGDGNLDLVFSNGTANTLSVLPGNDDGTFQTLKTIAVTSSAVGLVVGDFNADSTCDLAYSNVNSNRVSVMLNQSQASPGAGSASVGVVDRTHFMVTAPSSVTAGAAFNTTVTALDANNNPAFYYSGTVHFTSSDASAMLPADITLTSGTGTFSVTLRSAGNQTLSVTDSVNSAVTGTSNLVGVAPASATHFAVNAPASATAGSMVSFTVTALDQFNATAIGYSGTMLFTSTDSQAVLPTNATLTSGVGVFSVLLKTSGSKTVSVNDIITSTTIGTSAAIIVSPAAVAGFAIQGVPSSATAGSTFTLTVAANDTFGNVVTAYAGTVHFFSSDGQAVLPFDTVLTSGTGAFNVTLKTAGSQSLTVTDLVNTNVASSVSSTISAAAAARFTVTAPAIAVTATPFSVSVTTNDAFGNIATNYSGTVHFTSTDLGATLPANFTFAAADHGVHTFTNAFTLVAAGPQILTAADTITSTMAGSAAVTVPVTLSIPTTLTGGRGSITTVPLNVNGLSDPANGKSGISGGDFIVYYDPNLFSVADADVHLGSVATPASAWSLLANTSVPGQIVIGLSSSGNNTSTAGGSLVTIDFHVKSTAPIGAVSAIDLAADFSGGLPLTHVADQNAQDYVLTPPPLDGPDPNDGSITFVNQAPVASGDLYAVTERAVVSDPSLIVASPGVLANDTDPDGQPITASKVSNPSHGTVAVNSDGSFTYTPDLGYQGPDSFTYKASDGSLFSNTVTVNLNVTPRLSIPTNLSGVPGGTVVVPVNIDNPNPPGSGGLDAATLAVNYDPSIFTVDSSDVQTGTVTNSWSLTTDINAAAGQIGIHLASATPNTSVSAGSLALITLHIKSSTPGANTIINLAANNTANVGTVTTSLHTAVGGQLDLRPAVTNADNDVGVDGAVTIVGATHFVVSAPASAAAGGALSVTVTALDQFNATATSYSGSVHFTSNDSQVSLPTDATLSGGVGTFNATLKTVGTRTITATDTVNGIGGVSAGIAVSAAAATHFTVTAPASVTFGNAFSFSVVAKDAFNNTAADYAGTVHFTSSDSLASLPADAILSGGVGTLSATLKSSGSQKLSATDTAVTSITGTSNNISPAATHFVLSVPAATTAGDAFVFMVSAQDQFGVTATAYAGTVHFSSSDAKAGLPADVSLNNGLGFFAMVLKTAGSQSVTAVDKVNSALSGTTSAIVVSPAAANHFGFTVPANAATGVPFQFSVTALDPYNNVLTGYAGTVHFMSNDGAATVPVDATLTSGTGAFFATLRTVGNQLIIGTDTVTTSITGTSNLITARGLVVSAVTPTPLGFVASFNKPFDPSVVNLYDGVGTYGAADVTVIGPSGLVRGSLLLDPSSTSFTFIKTGAGTLGLFAGVLAAGNYTVTFRSAANGFKDTDGGLLDGNGDGVSGDNYVTTFTVGAASQPVLSIPDFARGPNGAVNIKVPQLNGSGIPITLTNASGVTDVTFKLNYNPALLSITSTLSNTSGTFTLVGTPSAGVANFSFHSNTALNGNVTLGQIVAQVPDSAASSYKAKELVHLSNIVLNGSITAVVNDDGVHVAAYPGDVSGDGSLSPLDAALTSRVATVFDTGFAAYRLADPAIVGDLNGNGFTDSSDVTLINRYLAGIAVGQLPPIPTGLTISPTGPDPTLSLPTDLQAAPGTAVVVAVNLDTARPDGSTGLMEAILALRYDPAVFTVSTSDVHLGSLPSSGSGWKLHSVVNAQTGEIGIDLFSATPIVSTGGGSLVTLTLHVLSEALAGASGINLVRSVSPTGQRQYVTTASDARGPYILHPAVTDGGDPGVDGVVNLLPKSTMIMQTTSAPSLAFDNSNTVAETVTALPPALAENLTPRQESVFAQIFADPEVARNANPEWTSRDSLGHSAFVDAPSITQDLAVQSPTANELPWATAAEGYFAKLGLAENRARKASKNGNAYGFEPSGDSFDLES